MPRPRTKAAVDMNEKPLGDTPPKAKVKPVRVRKAVQSPDPGETLRDQLLEDNQLVEPPEASLHLATKPPVKPPKESGLGSMAYSDTIMGPLFAQPHVKKHEKGRDKWANTALVLAYRAQKAAQTYGKKDFNALYRLVLSAGIAFDKAFPQQVQPLGGNLVIQLFGSLGSETARRILEPARPLLSDNPVASHTEVLDTTGDTLASDTEGVPAKGEPLGEPT